MWAEGRARELEGAPAPSPPWEWGAVGLGIQKDVGSLLVLGLSGEPCACVALGTLRCPPGQVCGVEQVASQRAAPATSRRLRAGYWGVSCAWGHSSSCSDGLVTPAALWVGEGEPEGAGELAGVGGGGPAGLGLAGQGPGD